MSPRCLFSPSHCAYGGLGWHIDHLFQPDIYNWCPGRSILPETNFWLNDLARMLSNDGIRAALLSLSGVYIYDYLPTLQISSRVNVRFSDADIRLVALLNDWPGLDSDKIDELVNISIILSTRDVS